MGSLESDERRDADAHPAQGVGCQAELLLARRRPQQVPDCRNDQYQKEHYVHEHVILPMPGDLRDLHIAERAV